MISTLRKLKSLMPNQPMSLPILRGPFRGGRFHGNPRVSLRKTLGLYESELNPWLAAAVRKADIVIDVGANDGYFTFGTAAAMRRLGRAVKVIAIEPLAYHVDQLEAGRTRGGFSTDEVTIVAKQAGAISTSIAVTLNSFLDSSAEGLRPLIKIDVEGAELEVLEGATAWLSSHAMLLIEVHAAEFLVEIPRRLAPIVGPLERVDQKALPLIGGEQRDASNWWLLSRLE